MEFANKIADEIFQHFQFLEGKDIFVRKDAALLRPVFFFSGGFLRMKFESRHLAWQDTLHTIFGLATLLEAATEDFFFQTFLANQQTSKIGRVDGCSGNS